MKRTALISLILRLCLPITKIINRINWRFGRPYLCTYKQIDSYKEHLHPGAVILTHKKYEFSTLFIPGYWTHSALVTSTGYIVEATGSGVHINSLESFFSTVDDFIVLKPRFCCKDTMKKAGRRASQLIGYPFSFDFRNTDEMFYCSGLICWVYTQTLAEKCNPQKFPCIFQNYLKGNIIKPMDLYAFRDSWQVFRNS